MLVTTRKYHWSVAESVGSHCFRKKHPHIKALNEHEYLRTRIAARYRNIPQTINKRLSFSGFYLKFTNRNGWNSKSEFCCWISYSVTMAAHFKVLNNRLDESSNVFFFEFPLYFLICICNTWAHSFHAKYEWNARDVRFVQWIEIKMWVTNSL